MNRRFLILYFSGTGNTDYVARQVYERILHFGHACVIKSVDWIWARAGRGPGRRGNEQELARHLAELNNGVTDLVLAYPTYASDVPRPLAEILPLLPDVDGVRMSVVATYALAGGDGCDVPERVLRPKGYKTFVTGYVKMPNNFKLPPVNHPEIENGAKLDHFHRSSAREIDEIVGHLIDGHRHTEGRGLGARLLGFSQRATEQMMAGAIARHMFATAACVKCRLCESTCPMGNITFTHEYPEFADRCCSCLRCYHSCPAEAIQVTDKTRDTDKYPRYKGFDHWHPPRLYQKQHGEASHGGDESHVAAGQPANAPAEAATS